MTEILLVFIISIHLMSQVFMTTRATAQVALRPMGPPDWWVGGHHGQDSYLGCHSNNQPLLELCPGSAGKTQFSAFPGLALTPGLTPFLVVLLRKTLYRGDLLCSSSVMCNAIYKLATL